MLPKVLLNVYRAKLSPALRVQVYKHDVLGAFLLGPTLKLTLWAVKNRFTLDYLNLFLHRLFLTVNLIHVFSELIPPLELEGAVRAGVRSIL